MTESEYLLLEDSVYLDLKVDKNKTIRDEADKAEDKNNSTAFDNFKANISGLC